MAMHALINTFPGPYLTLLISFEKALHAHDILEHKERPAFATAIVLWVRAQKTTIPNGHERMKIAAASVAHTNAGWYYYKNHIDPLFDNIDYQKPPSDDTERKVLAARSTGHSVFSET